MATDDVEVLAIGIAAIVGGVYVLRGANWARWLLAAWMALHVAISLGQPTALLAHVAIFGFVAYLLFRPGASVHFAVAPTTTDPPSPSAPATPAGDPGAIGDASVAAATPTRRLDVLSTRRWARYLPDSGHALSSL